MTRILRRRQRRVSIIATILAAFALVAQPLFSLNIENVLAASIVPSQTTLTLDQSSGFEKKINIDTSGRQNIEVEAYLNWGLLDGSGQNEYVEYGYVDTIGTLIAIEKLDGVANDGPAERKTVRYTLPAEYNDKEEVNIYFKAVSTSGESKDAVYVEAINIHSDPVTPDTTPPVISNIVPVLNTTVYLNDSGALRVTAEIKDDNVVENNPGPSITLSANGHTIYPRAGGSDNHEYGVLFDRLDIEETLKLSPGDIFTVIVTAKDPAGNSSTETSTGVIYGGYADTSDENNEHPDPDPSNSHQLRMSGKLYRDNALNDCDNRGECLSHSGDYLDGFEVRLYEDTLTGWKFVQSRTTNATGDYMFSSISHAGTFYNCFVQQAGWTQSAQAWSGSGFLVNTPNQSGDDSEAPYCVKVFYDDSKDNSHKANIGNVDTQKPTTEVTSPAASGSYYGEDFTITAKSFDHQSGLEQLTMNLYNSNGLLRSCVNLPLSPSSEESVFTCDIDVNQLGEGDYYVKVNARDASGMTSNTVTWRFTIDLSSPNFALETPINGAAVKDVVDIRARITDNSGMKKVLMSLPTKNGNKTYVYEAGKTNNTLTKDGDIYSVSVDTSVMNSGVAYVVLRGTDIAGNTRYWNNNAALRQHSFVVDNEDPSTTLGAPSGVVGSTFTVKGVAKDNRALNRVYVQLVNRQDHNRYGGTTINLIGKGTEAEWSRLYDVKALNLPDGEYAAHVSVVDMLGNTGSDGWTDNFAVDSHKPTEYTATIAGQTFVDTILSDEVTFDVAQEESHPDRMYIEYNHLVDAKWKKYAGEYFYDANNGSLTVDTSAWADGDYQLKVSSRDHAGNGSSATFAFRVDNTGPSIVTNLTENQMFDNSEAMTISGLVNDGMSRVNRVVMYINDETGQQVDDSRQVLRSFGEGGEWAFTVPADLLEDGRYRVIINAYDELNNPAQASRIFINIANTVEEDFETVTEDSGSESPRGEGSGSDAPSGQQTRSSSQSSRGIVAGVTAPQQAVFGLVQAATTPVWMVATAIAEDNDETDDEEVLSATDEQVIETQQEPAGDNETLGDESEEAGFLAGIAWYWWPVIILPVALLTWWVIAPLRRKLDEV